MVMTIKTYTNSILKKKKMVQIKMKTTAAINRSMKVRDSLSNNKKQANRCFYQQRKERCSRIRARMIIRPPKTVATP